MLKIQTVDNAKNNIQVLMKISLKQKKWLYREDLKRLI